MKINIGKFPKKADRKISVQIERFDTWSLDHTLALIILPALLQLKTDKHGVPSSVVEDVGGEDWSAQDCFDFYKDTHDAAFREAAKRWDVILDKMIWSFQQIVVDDYSAIYHHGDMSLDWIDSDITYPNPVTGKLEKTYQLLDNDKHWFDSTGYFLHEERIQEGLELFGRHYRSLWD